MSRVITFSRTYPSYHPRAGEPTYFVEKICAGLADKIAGFKPPEYIPGWNLHEFCNAIPKWHTIREGHRFKAGDKFSPRVWGDDVNPKSGRSGPYHSKMITFAPDIEAVKGWYFDISGHDGKFFINGSPFTPKGIFIDEVSGNDGLTPEDFKAWFKHPKPFSGQIICWNENINY